MIGCDCPVCTSTDPRDNRTRSSLLVQTPELAFAVDTGPDFRTQCLREGVRTLQAVIYTHAHTDHIMGFDDLRRFCDQLPDYKLPIYAAAGTMADIQRVFGFAFDAPVRYAGYVHPEPHIVSGPFDLGATRITPLPVPHGRFTVNGYLFERAGRRLFAYLSDCKSVPPEIREQIMDVEVLAIDALRQRPHPTHLSVSEALEVAAAVRAGQTWFTHICHDLSHAETDATLPAGVRLAYDGLQISL